MTSEIERKFFVKEMPDISGIKPLRYERYGADAESVAEAKPILDASVSTFRVYK